MANEKRLIDANAVLRRMNKHREDFADGWKTLDAMPNGAKCKYEENLECALMIEDAPTVETVEVVHSSWILNDDGSGTCKHCHRTTKSCWDFDNQMNYCPNCGADMR